MPALRLDGRVAVVTGAGNGLGRAYALELASRGARVVVNDLGGSVAGEGRDPGVAEAVAREIRDAGGEAVADTGDVSVPEDMEALIDAAVSTWGRVDIVVNNAGLAGVPMFGPPADWDRVLGVNLHGVVNTLRAAWPHFEDRGFGRVVNTASSSFLGTPFAGAYAAAKGGVIGLTKVLASTYPGGDGTGGDIRINAIMPVAGTRMTARVPDEVYRDWLMTHFRPEKVAAFVPVLCADEVPVHGETFVVGGGRAARVLFQTTAGWFEKEPTAESFLQHFDEVMAGNDARVAAGGQGDLVRYADLLGDRGPF